MQTFDRVRYDKALEIALSTEAEATAKGSKDINATSTTLKFFSSQIVPCILLIIEP